MKKSLLFQLVLVLININYVYCENYFGGSKGSNSLYRWSTTNIHYRVHESGAGDNGLDYNATSSLIQAAYSVWDNVSTSNITFTLDGSVSGGEGYDGVSGHYWVYPPHAFFDQWNWFYDDPNTPQIEGASAITLFDWNNNVLTDVDIVYNGKKEWKGTDYLTWWNEVESVAIHEIGHSLGIAHADNGLSPVPVMTYAADPSSDRRTLKDDDKKAVSFLYGGNLIDNETFAGTNYFNWNISIASGKTLTFQPGSSVTFSNSSSLTINGTLYAVGTSSSGISFSSGGTWGGIQFNSGSSGNLQYCTIQYASTGVYCYNSSPTIKYSTIDNNTSTGLYCNYYSSPVLVGNNFRFNTSYGVRCNSFSSPNLTDNGYPGSNVIRNNSVNGLNATYNCNPNLNGYMTYGNSVFDNSSYEVVAYYNCTVNADRVYWGATYPPPDGEFYAYQSTINRNYPLQTNPNPGRMIITNDDNKNSIPISISYSVQADDLSLAEQKQKEGKYDEAIPLFLEVFKNNKDALVGKYALIKIEECFTQAGMKDFLEYSKKELEPIIKTATETFVVLLELETHQLVNAGLHKEAMDNLFLIKNKHNLNKEIDKNTIYRIGVFYAQLYGDKQNAQKYFDELKTKYPGDDLVNDIDRWINTPNVVSNNGSYIAVVQTAAETPAAENSGVSVENYPNPFNPTTKISFSIPQKNQIKLKVFDILGREVANLAEGVYETGKYELTFDASKLPSGIYFYNLITESNSITKKMLLVK